MFLTLVIPSVSLTLLASYAIRIFEGPTKARHSLYFWDQMWMVHTPQMMITPRHPTHPALLPCSIP